MSSEFFVAKKKKAVLEMPDGSKHEGRFPTHGERQEFRRKTKETEGAENLDVVEEFFTKLGFPAEAINELDGNDFQDFVAFLLSGGKKN